MVFWSSYRPPGSTDPDGASLRSSRGRAGVKLALGRTSGYCASLRVSLSTEVTKVIYQLGLCRGSSARPTGATAMSIQNVASPAITLNPPMRNLLAHIPGDEGWPVIGRTLAILADPKGEVERMAAKHGLVYRSRVLGETSITVLGPEANELVLFDQTKLFSSTYGWETILGRF